MYDFLSITLTETKFSAKTLAIDAPARPASTIRTFIALLVDNRIYNLCNYLNCTR